MSTLDKKIEQFFWDADADRSGSLTLVELRAALARNGYVMTDEQFKEKFATFDKDQDGIIFFHEYLEGMGRHPAEVRRFAEIARVFKLFDLNGNGYIAPEEVAGMFKKRGRNLTKGQVKRIMSGLDKDRSGRIEMDEFIDVYDNMK